MNFLLNQVRQSIVHVLDEWAVVTPMPLGAHWPLRLPEQHRSDLPTSGLAALTGAARAFGLRRFRSIDHGNRVDLDETARIGRQPDDLNRRRRWFGLTEIFGPDTIERVLIAEIGDKAIGGDDIGKACADRLQAALEIVERRPRLPLHVRRHGVELFRPMRMVMIDRSGGDTGQVDGRPAAHLDRRRIGHPQIGGVGPMHMLDGLGHGAYFREVSASGEGQHKSRSQGKRLLSASQPWLAYHSAVGDGPHRETSSGQPSDSLP